MAQLDKITGESGDARLLDDDGGPIEDHDPTIEPGGRRRCRTSAASAGSATGRSVGSCSWPACRCWRSWS